MSVETPSTEALNDLVARRDAFVSFVQARVGDRALAEELVQGAFVRTLERGGAIRDDESAIAWLYRVLRNAIIDHFRHDAAGERAHERLAGLGDVESAFDPTDRASACACIATMLPALEPAYAEILRRVDLEDEPLAVAAAALDITVNNATVRVHRARRALEARVRRTCGTCAEHGCFDCTCQPVSADAGASKRTDAPG